jgi:phenylacetate-CoA ligase
MRSSVTGMRFPALPGGRGTLAAALQFQLERSQWLSPEALRELQRAQLRSVLEHAVATVPFYEDYPLHPVLDELPILRRDAVLEAAEALRSTALPADHGKQHRIATSGATGTPVRLWGTDLTGFLWRAFTLREHLWQGREFSAKLAAIRWAAKDFAAAPEGRRWPGWGDAVELLYETGPACMLNVATPLAQQIDWLLAEQPKYLVSFPSNLAALAEHCLERGTVLPGLQEVRTIGEMLLPRQRELFRQAWGGKVTDMYSCEEAGYLALQCPEAEHYHVQSENVILEIVNGEGKPCAPGEPGRVLITTLHNFATPLVRYELGDVAELGPSCACGRGLPVLAKIHGRRRNRLRLPDGRSEFPYLGEHGQIAAATGVKVRQFQFVQKSTEEVEVKLVTDRDFTPQEAARARALVQRNLGHPFRIVLTRCDEIPRGPGGKLEEFVSEVP